MLYKKYFKRIIDFMGSLILLILLSPLFAVIAIIIHIDSNGPIFFTQKRLGLNGTIYKIYKFRTMKHLNRDSKQVFLEDPEITKIGKLLRRFKIDEIPQLINIISGDMSFIGPRPCLPELESKFDQNGKFRILVRPGLSGLAQINGNIHLSWNERWKFDRFYVENLSILLDLTILLKTFAIVIFGEENFINKRK